jgi:hypothetical protein
MLCTQIIEEWEEKLGASLNLMRMLLINIFAEALLCRGIHITITDFRTLHHRYAFQYEKPLFHFLK